MNKQSFLLVGVALVLATLYIVYFTDWLKHPNIQISYRISPASGLMAFYLDKSYPLTSIEVVSTEDAKTNKYPHAFWHVVAQSAPVAMKFFNYGANLPGMKPEVASALPEPLESGTDYTVIVATPGSIKGETSFKVR